ncbi:MAG TPA: ice-binding family protein [Candidatus Acidoferrum sp.]|nr:ice-binding family protein [Candidatus Acidoferrum sp.]
MKESLIGLIIATATLLLHTDAAAAQPTIMHLNFKRSMTTDDGVGNANDRGSVEETATRRNSISNQRLAISLANLEPNTTYQFVALLGDDANQKSVGEFSTDNRGAYKVLYVKNGKNGTPRGGATFPLILDPLCNVRELNVLNTNSELVLRAVLTNPNKGPYSIKGPLKKTGFAPAAAGNFQIRETPLSTHFRLTASGLTANSDYVLFINGTAVQTNTAGRKGKLGLIALPAVVPKGLDIHSLALTDSTGANVILHDEGFGIPCSTSVVGTIPLGAAANFAVLAGATVTSTGNSDVTGDVGVWAGSAVSGFQGVLPGGPGVVHGTIHPGDAAAQIAQGDLTTAYNNAAGKTLAPVDVANADLGGQTLVPGLYKSTGTLALTGTVTLDARGDANAVFIFQIASSLDTASGSQVVLSGEAKAANVFWQVGTSATLATTTAFKGTIMADQSITMATGATLEGRALARIAAITLDANAITLPTP